MCNFNEITIQFQSYLFPELLLLPTRLFSSQSLRYSSKSVFSQWESVLLWIFSFSLRLKTMERKSPCMWVPILTFEFVSILKLHFILFKDVEFRRGILGVLVPRCIRKNGIGSHIRILVLDIRQKSCSILYIDCSCSSNNPVNFYFLSD